MNNIAKYYKIIIAGSSVCGGAALIHYAFLSDEKLRLFDSSSSPCGSVKWDWNWDKRDQNSITAEIKDDYGSMKKSDVKLPTAIRNIILIRHGQYNLAGKVDTERTLTDLGIKQAQVTGERLKNLNYPYTNLIASTLMRAHETASIIQTALKDLSVQNCSLLEEGAPVPPEPPSNMWQPDCRFYQDGARIESAFRKYFHRAHVSQKFDSYDVIVCHANVIRYFVCRALQLPPEAWLRLSLHHCGVTWIVIYPSGRVSLRMFGDSGHIPRYLLTS